MAEDATRPLLAVRGLEVHFPVARGLLSRRAIAKVRAVDGVDLDLARGEAVGLVGESGCGKSTLGRAILQLIRPSAGEVRFDGRELGGLAEAELRPMRRRMQMVFQDPFSSLNPRMTVGNAVIEPMLAHGLASRSDAGERAAALFRMVGLDPQMLRRYPHEFSGGQRQRVGIARALAVEPDFVVCDEPVSSLDVSIQAQILNLLIELRHRLGLTYVFISHDLAVVRHLADTVAVMYLGEIVEHVAAERLFEAPAHPYTRSLLAAVPEVGGKHAAARDVVESETGSAEARPSGCAFHPRCPVAQPRCRTEPPPLMAIGPDRSHRVRCWLYG